MSPFFCPLWTVRLKKQIQEQGSVRTARAKASAKPVRNTRVRSRCDETEPQAVTAEVASAMPSIVRATVKKAKAGSLQHAKWLWELNRARVVEEQKTQAPQSLAALLMERLQETL